MNYNFFVRCVGIGTGIYQSNTTCAYDHRLICFLKGNGRIYVEKEKYETEAGLVFFIKPGTSYRVCCSDNQEIAVINFDTTQEYSSKTAPILSVNAMLFNPEEALKTIDIPFIPAMMRINTDDQVLLYRMYDCYLRNDLAEESKHFCLSSLLSYVLSRGLILAKDSKPSETSSKIYKYIIDNSTFKITVDEVAKHFNYSASFIEKTLRKNYQISFKQLIIETRLKKALWYLENTDLSCTEIATQLGFSSGQHFSNSFIKKYGKRPSEINKLN